MLTNSPEIAFEEIFLSAQNILLNKSLKIEDGLESLFGSRSQK
jgi:hypothetical protein